MTVLRHPALRVAHLRAQHLSYSMHPNLTQTLGRPLVGTFRRADPSHEGRLSA